jgi:hypothetical protein
MAVVTVPACTSACDRETGRVSVFPGGEVTVTVEAMSPVQVADWAWMFEVCDPGLPEDVNRRSVRGWTVRHPAAGVLGVLLQNLAGRFHVEWFDAGLQDYRYGGQAARWRHAVAYIVQARQQSAQPVPVDPAPAPAAVPVPAAPLRPLRRGALVRYRGSLKALHGEFALAFACDCEEDLCDGYRLEPPTVGGALSMCLVHVHRSSLVEADS